MTLPVRERDVVCLSTNHWTGLPTSKQHLMSVLGETRSVLYVDPPLDVFSVVGRRRRWPMLLPLRDGAPGVHVVSPLRLSGAGDPDARRRYYERLTPRVVAAARRLGIERPIVWAFGPEHVGCAAGLERAVLVYQASDDPAAFESSTESIRRLESEMLAAADVVFAVSDRLVKSREEAHGRVSRLPNAADRRHYSLVLTGSEDADADAFIAALGRSDGTPAAFAAARRPLVMYGGAAYDWFDADLFLGLARARPDWTFALVGPVSGRLAGARLPRNVLVEGRRPYGEFPLYVRSCDVAVIPWKRGTFSENADPIVLYEYLLCGKPVVATPFPAAIEKGGLVRTADTAEGLISAVEAALREDRVPSSVRERVEFGFANTWENRVEQALDAIEEAA